MSGRSGLGAELLEQLPAEAEEKRRLKAILLQICGEITVGEACAQIGVKASRYYELRECALQGALGALDLRPAGRPRSREAEPLELVRLRAERDRLERENHLLRVRQEVLEALPGVVSWAAAKGAAPQKRGAGRARWRATRGKAGAR